MKTTNDGGAAFPWLLKKRGLSVRQYFAAAALPAVIACTDMTEPGAYLKVARRALQIADALLESER